MRFVRRRLGASVDDEDGDEPKGREAAKRTQAKPALVKFAKLIAEVIGKKRRETNCRASQRGGEETMLKELLNVHDMC